MQLNNVLKRSFTSEEYLAHQREIHKDRCGAKIAEIRKKADDAAYIGALEREAVYAMQNLFILPGTRGKRFDVGTPPAWNECRTDDEEYLWSLNRMGYFHTLVPLYLLKGDKEHAKKVLLDMEDWVDTCPLGKLPDENTTREEMNAIRRFFSGLTPWRSLEVGIRMFDSWNYAYDRLLFDELMTPELHSKLAYSFYEHALVLREMSPRYWPDANHNHYIHEMLGLFEIACIFPDFDMSDSWREFAIKELVRCAKAQFTPDGGQIEGSPGYHSGCLNMFFSFVEAAREFDVVVPEEIVSACAKATNYVLMASGPDGIINPFGDTAYSKCIPGTVTRYYSCFGELGPVAKAFAISPACDSKIVPEEVQEAAREYAPTAPSEDNVQRQINQYFARSGWKREDAQFGFMCQSPVFNGHAHIDPMTFVLYLKGDPVVVDPSYYTYRECEERKLFKSAEYHSTLTIGGKQPYEYVQRWVFGPQKEGGIRKSYRLDGVYAADASHHCYDPDYHKRLCALVGDDTFIVADEVINVTGSEVAIYFHMDDPTVKVEGRVAKSDRITVLLPDGVSGETVPAEKSLHTDITVPSCRLVLKDDSCKTRQYLTVFTKRDDITEPKIERTPDGVEISYLKGGERVAFLWTFSCSLKRI